MYEVSSNKLIKKGPILLFLFSDKQINLNLITTKDDGLSIKRNKSNRKMCFSTCGYFKGKASRFEACCILCAKESDFLCRVVNLQVHVNYWDIARVQIPLFLLSGFSGS